MAEYLDQRDGDGEDVKVFDLDTDEELDVRRRIVSFSPSGSEDIAVFP